MLPSTFVGFFFGPKKMCGSVGTIHLGRIRHMKPRSLQQGERVLFCFVLFLSYPIHLLL